MLRLEDAKKVITSAEYKAYPWYWVAEETSYRGVTCVAFVGSAEDCREYIRRNDSVEKKLVLYDRHAVIYNNGLNYPCVRNIRELAYEIWNKLSDTVHSALYENDIENLECCIRSLAFQNDNNIYDPDLRTELYFCQECGKYCMRSEFTNSTRYCNSCAEKYRKCNVCGAYRVKTEMIDYKSIKVPMTATEKSRFIKGACRSCVASLTEEYKYAANYHDAPSDTPLFFNYSRRNTPINANAAQDSKTRYFGIEFEFATNSDELMVVYGCEDGEYFDTDEYVDVAVRNVLEDIENAGYPRHIYAESDGSIDPYGYEFITNPITLEYAEKTAFIDTFIDSVEQLGFYANSSCGMHVHVNRSSLNKYSVAKMNVMLSRLEYYNSTGEQIISDISGRGASKLDDWSKVIDFGTVHQYRLDTQAAYHEIYSIMQKNDRYVALNSKNRNTVEFRFFGATTDKKLIMERLYFINALCTYANNFSLQDCMAVTTQVLRDWDNRCGDLFDRYDV